MTPCCLSTPAPSSDLMINICRRGSLVVLHDQPRKHPRGFRLGAMGSRRHGRSWQRLGDLCLRRRNRRLHNFGSAGSVRDHGRAGAHRHANGAGRVGADARGGGPAQCRAAGCKSAGEEDREESCHGSPHTPGEPRQAVGARQEPTAPPSPRPARQALKESEPATRLALTPPAPPGAAR